jgi:uracil-DNA glycosylase family 4
MSLNRAAILAELGLERWVLRQAPGAAAATAPVRPAPMTATGGLAVAADSIGATPVSASVPTTGEGDHAEAPAPLPRLDDWATLAATVANCQRCRLCETRTQTVLGVGPRPAPLMIVGEGPGADEDAQGEPFVGRAGKLLDEMLAAIGCSRHTDTYIANVVKCRPPGNRDPAQDEAEACRPFLEAQIAAVRPRLIVALGRIAAQRLLGTEEPLSRLRGPLHHYGPERTPLFVSYHPAYLLRSPREKAKSWLDLKLIHRHLHAEQR